jgi:serine/threonine protein kinase
MTRMEGLDGSQSPNVMLAWDSAQSRLVAKLCDFGSAAHLDRLPEQGFAQRIGTALWMPPEMLSSRSRAAAELEAQLAAGDVYSFAMTLWEMLTGTVPWAEELYNKSERRGAATTGHSFRLWRPHHSHK